MTTKWPCGLVRPCEALKPCAAQEVEATSAVRWAVKDATEITVHCAACLKKGSEVLGKSRSYANSFFKTMKKPDGREAQDRIRNVAHPPGLARSCDRRRAWSSDSRAEARRCDARAPSAHRKQYLAILWCLGSAFGSASQGPFSSFFC